MAVPSYASDLNDIFTDGGSWTILAGRATDPDSDDYIQGASCWSHDPFSSGIEGGVVNSAETIAAGDAVFIWTKADISPALATKAAGGVQALIGNASTALKCFYIRGSDDLIYGGWQCIPVDPTKSPSTNIGSPSSVTDYFGVRWNIPSTGPSKGYPFKIDAIRHGKDLEVTAGEVANPASWDTVSAYDAVSTRMWGICQPTDTGAALQGYIYWGTAAAQVYSRDSNRAIVILDTEWTDTDFTQIIFAHASNDILWDNVGLLALGTNNRGIIDVTANGTVVWTNSTYQGIDTTTLLSGSTFDGSKWIGCNEVDGSAASLLNCKILVPTVAANSHGLLWDTATSPDGKLDGMEFSMGAADHHAITFGTTIGDGDDITLRGINFIDFGSTDDSNDSTVEFLATSGALTLTLIDCTVGGAAATSGNFSIDDGAGITVTLSIPEIVLTLTGLPSNTEVTIVNASTRAELHHTENSSGDETYEYSSGGTVVDVLMHHVNYDPHIGQLLDYTLPSVSTSLPVSLVLDNTYDP